MNESMGAVPPVPSAPVMKGSFIKNTSRSMSALYLLIASLIGGAVTLSRTGSISLQYIIIFTVFMFVIGFISAVVINFTTRIFKIANRSLARSIMFTAINMALSFVLAYLVYTFNMPTLVMGIISFVASILIFGHMYETRFLKSLGTLIVSSIFTIIMFIVVGIIVSMAGFGLMKFFLQGLSNKDVNVPTYNNFTQTPASENVLASANNNSQAPVVDNNSSMQSYSQPEGMFSVKYPASFKLSVSPAMGSGAATKATSISLNYLDISTGKMALIGINPAITNTFPGQTLDSEWNSLKSQSTYSYRTKVAGFDAVGKLSVSTNGSVPTNALTLYVKGTKAIYQITEMYTPDQSATINSVIDSITLK